MRCVLLLAAACATSPSPDDVPRDPAVRGPWGVGVTTLSAIDRAGTPLVVEVWYPASPDPDAEPETTLGIPTTAIRDAPIDHRGAPFPIVGFSHGAGGLRVQSVYLTEHLASWGYLVVAPDHPHDTLGSSSDQRPEVLRARPQQISASIDAAASTFEIADPTRIGVAGHSFGAFTALALAGGRLDIAALRAACADDPDQLVCSGVDDALTQEVADGFADPRIAAAVALAPAGRIAFGPSGLGAIARPIQLQAGTADTLAAPATEVAPMFAALTGPASYASIDRAAHFSFTDLCSIYELSGGADGPLGFLASQGCGEDTLPAERAHAASRTLATAFFDLHLRGVADQHGYLAGVPDAAVESR